LLNDYAPQVPHFNCLFDGFDDDPSSLQLDVNRKIRMAIELFIQPCHIFDTALRRSVSTLFCASANQKLRAVVAVSGRAEPA
jgi:hypothetical protein